MEGSDHLFQLDEDDLFNNDSFLEELEQADKVENAVSKHKQTVSRPGHQQNTFSKTHTTVPSMHARTATSGVPQARTPGGEGRKFSFKSKTSPEIPLPPSVGSSKQGALPISTGERIGVDWNKNIGLVQENRNQLTSSRKDPVNPMPNVNSNKLPQSMAKIPSPLANLRQLNSKRFTPVTPVNTMSKEACDKKNLGSESSSTLDTSLDEFKEPTSASKSVSHKSLGQLRPTGSTLQNSRPQMSSSDAVQGAHGTVTQSISRTPKQSPGIVRKPVMTSPPQRPCTPHQQGTPQTINKTPQTPLSSRVGSMPYEQFNNRTNNRSSMNTPAPAGAFQGRQSCANMQVRHNVGQSPSTRSGNANPGYNNQSRGRGVSSYNQTPPPRRHDLQYGTNSHRTTPGSAVATPAMHGRGKNFPGRGQPQQDLTHRQHTPVAGHAQQQRTPVAGHAQRQHPSLNRPPINQRQSTPGQPSRPVLTPRVAQLCKGSGPSPGTGSVHGGTRKFPGPAGLLPKLSPGQKLKDAAAALKKKVEEEELSQETEESSEEISDVGDFEHGAWFRMKAELGIKDGDPSSILQQNNINLVIRKASLKQLTKNKVNHLCVMIKTISLNSSDASVCLCDPSGEMQGTIHRRLIEEYQGDLRPGSVLVLRQVGVLSPSQRNHYLNITPSNLIQVFPGESNSRPGSQKTPKRTRKHSGRSMTKKRPSEEESGNEQRSSPVTGMGSATGRRGEDDDGLGSSDVPDVVAMDADKYLEDDDAGIWEEMLEDEDEEDVLLMDSQLGAGDAKPGLNVTKKGPTGERRAAQSKNLDGVNSAKSSSLSISPRPEDPAMAQFSQPKKRSPPVSSAGTTSSSSSSLSSSGVLPVTTKRCHPVSSKPTPSVVKCPEEIKRPCLRDISGLGSNTGGGFKSGGPNKGLNSCREESIGDLLDGLEDELFDDF
ncbi:uncharacterized protein LOC121426710 [Lytechinus variegatus]|uniref:uncharacterized protein LOC121426710 n=1 Tax=Lytechinus variegatus TaxID=7654 RepID=UPI001BB12289|nr:uncharacterized protein LOC121426710 [Lytechinus variegatus]